MKIGEIIEKIEKLKKMLLSKEIDDLHEYARMNAYWALNDAINWLQENEKE